MTPGALKLLEISYWEFIGNFHIPAEGSHLLKTITSIFSRNFPRKFQNHLSLFQNF